MVERPDVHRGGEGLKGGDMKEMGQVYILQTRGNHYYVGSTNDLGRRLSEHRSGKTKSLKKLLPLKLLFSQEFSNLKEARKIEARLKKFKSRKIIEMIIKEGRITMGP